MKETFRLFYQTVFLQNSSRPLHNESFWIMNNYCCGRCVPRQLLKCTWRNTVTFFRTLVESQKRLKGTEMCPVDILEKRLFEKKLIWINWINWFGFHFIHIYIYILYIYIYIYCIYRYCIYIYIYCIYIINIYIYIYIFIGKTEVIEQKK